MAKGKKFGRAGAAFSSNRNRSARRVNSRPLRDARAERLEPRQLLTAVVAPIDPTMTGVTGPVPSPSGHSVYVQGVLNTWTNTSAIIPNTNSDLVLNVHPQSDYQACCEGGGGTVDLLTNGTTQALVGGKPDGGANDPSNNTDILSDLTTPWSATYQLGGSSPSSTGYDLTEVDSITGHQDDRTQQHIDIAVEYVNSNQFVSLSGGAGFTLTADAGGKPLSGGSVQMAIVNPTPGTPIATNVKAVQFVSLAGDPAFFRELVVTGQASTPQVAPPSAAPTNVAASFVNGLASLTFTDNANNETGFNILRSENGGQASQVGTVGAVAATGGTGHFVDRTTKPGTTYSYMVVAYNAAGTVSSAQGASLTTPAASSTGGAEAHYYGEGFWAGAPVIQKTVPTVDFSWTNGTPDPAIRNAGNSAIFTGQIQADTAGPYTFVSNTDDDGYLYVDGQLVSSDPGGHAKENAPEKYVHPLQLQPGLHPFVLRQSQWLGGSDAHLEWVTPEMAAAGVTTPIVVPRGQLTPNSGAFAAPPTLARDNATPNVVTFTVSNAPANAAFLELQRSDDGGNAWETVNQTEPATSISDYSPIPGADAQYRVVATNFDANPAPSTPVDVTVPSATTTATGGVEVHVFDGERVAQSDSKDQTSFISNLRTGTDGGALLGPQGFDIWQNVDKDFGNGSPLNGPHTDSFTTVATGKIVAPSDGLYTFVTNTDDDGYLYIDGQLVSSDPGGHVPENATKVTPIQLDKGSAHDFVFLQDDIFAGSAAHLLWQVPNSSQLVPIPAWTAATNSGLQPVQDTPIKYFDYQSTNGVLHWKTFGNSTLWYEIQRSESGPSLDWTTIGRAGFGATTFTDPSPPAQSFFYRIRAVNFDGAGPWSELVSADSAPRVTAQSLTPGQIDFAFTGVDQGSTRVQLRYATSPSGQFTVLTTLTPDTQNWSLTASEATSLGLDTSKTYYFTVDEFFSSNYPFVSAPAGPVGFSGPVPVQHQDGFAGATDLQLNGTANITADGALQLTPYQSDSVGSAFTLEKEPVNSFDANFKFTWPQEDAEPGDGFTFVISNDPAGPGAIGQGGGGLGYQGIQKSVALKFDIYPNESQIGVYLDGAAPADAPVVPATFVDTTPPATPGTAIDMTALGVDFIKGSSQQFEAHLHYANGWLRVAIPRPNYAAPVVQYFAVDIPGTVGSNFAYVGFTGATGAAAADQRIQTFDYTGHDIAPAPPDAPTNGRAELVDVDGPGTPAVRVTYYHTIESDTIYRFQLSTDGGTTYKEFAWRYDSGGLTYELGSNTGTPTTVAFLDAPLPNTTYLFRVVAENGIGSTASNPVTFTTAQALIRFAAIPIGSGAVNMEFQSVPAGSGGIQLQMSTDGSTYSDVPGASMLPPDTRSWPVTGLTPGGTYYFRARNLAGPDEDLPSDYAVISDPVVASAPPPINYDAGFSANDPNFTAAGGTTLELTSVDLGNEANSAFTTSEYDVEQFTTAFTFKFAGAPPLADGFTFTIQADPNLFGAVGSSGGGLGYQGIARSVALKFDLWPGSQSGVYVNGAAPSDSPNQLPSLSPVSPGTAVDLTHLADGSPSGFQFRAGDIYLATIVYDGSVLHEVITDQTTGNSVAQDYSVDIPAVIGEKYAFIGFTGATGGAHAEQDILTWDFAPLPPSTGQVSSGTSGNDTITLERVPGTNLVQSIDGAGNVLQTSDASQPITINGGGGNDTVVLDDASGNLIASQIVLTGSNFNVGNLSIGAGDSLTVAPTTTGQPLTITASSLDMTGGMLNLEHNVLVVNKPPPASPSRAAKTVPFTETSLIARIRGYLAAGSQGGILGGDGTGRSTLAYADSDDGLIPGQPQNTILIETALKGDANLDGKVDFTDLLLMAQGYGRNDTTWHEGDFNYDGTVGFPDLLILAQNYGQKGAAATVAAALRLRPAR